MNDQLQALLVVTGRLDSIGIDYMISGSTALNFYTRPRMTRDIDIVVELIPRDVPILIEKLSEEFYIDDEAVIAAVDSQSMFNVLHEPTMTKVDFIVRKNDTYREVEFGRRRTVDLAGVSLKSVAPEDLILSKLVWSRDSESSQQTDDIQMLLKVQNLDQIYLEQWATELGVADRLEKLRR